MYTKVRIFVFFSVNNREIAVILISGLLENKTKKEVDKLSDSIIYGWDAHWVVGLSDLVNDVCLLQTHS